MNWHSIYFLLFSLAACGFAVAVVLSSNIVRMAFYLVLSLGATAGLFFLAGADFIGAMQLLIYVGGTLVLLIFGVMLTAQSPFISMKPRPGDWVAAAIVGGMLIALLIQAGISVPDWQNGPAEVRRRRNRRRRPPPRWAKRCWEFASMPCRKPIPPHRPTPPAWRVTCSRSKSYRFTC